MNTFTPSLTPSLETLLEAQRKALARFREDENDLAEMIADAVTERFAREAGEMIGDEFCYSDQGEAVLLTLTMTLADAFDTTFERIALKRLKTHAEQVAPLIGDCYSDAEVSLDAVRRGLKLQSETRAWIDEALRAALPTATTMLGALFSEIFEDIDEQIDRFDRNRKEAAVRAQRAIEALEPRLRQKMQEAALTLLRKARLGYAEMLDKAERQCLTTGTEVQ